MAHKTIALTTELRERLLEVHSVRISETIRRRLQIPLVKRLITQGHASLHIKGRWVHSSVVRAADCRSAGPWFKSGCALIFEQNRYKQSRHASSAHSTLAENEAHSMT